MDPVTGLSLGRIAAGTLSLTRPRLAATLLGVDGPGNPQLPFVTRLFGVREVAIGAATLLATGAARRDLVTAGVLVDLGDAAASVVALRSGEVGARSAAPLLAVALGAVVVGAADLATARPR